MARRRILTLLPLLLTSALGCTTLSGGTGSCPPSIEQAFHDPRVLRAAADEALSHDDYALAYRYLSLIEIFSPDGADARELYPAAAKLFKTAYLRSRVKGKDSVWVTSEPVFMFQWLARFFSDDGEFPQQQVDLLFARMPITLLDDFKAFAKPRPHLARWDLHATDDDGRIETITAKLAVPVDRHAQELPR
jgi:hypothetical protein